MTLLSFRSRYLCVTVLGLAVGAPRAWAGGETVPSAGLKAAEQGSKARPKDAAAKPKDEAPKSKAGAAKPRNAAAKPKHAAAKPKNAAKPRNAATTPPARRADGPSYHTTVVDHAADADRVGAYQQPVWTTTRQFTTTRVYVLPKGEAEIEYWLRTRGDLKSGHGPAFESQLEFSYGLGARLQLDVYLAMEQEHYNSALKLAAEKIELRYAFADWGRLPGNPTLYLEWIRQHEGPMKAEGKLLFGGQFTPKVFWGLNLVYESELGGEYEGEWAVSYGLAAVLKRRLVLFGFEAKLEGAHVQDGHTPRFADLAFVIGPSLALKPGRFHILLVPLFGVKHVRGLQPGEPNETKGVYSIWAVAGVTL